MRRRFFAFFAFFGRRPRSAAAAFADAFLRRKNDWLDAAAPLLPVAALRWLRVVFPASVIVCAFGGMMMLPALVSVLMGDGMAAVYLRCGGWVMAGGGAVMLASYRPAEKGRRELQVRHGFIIVCLLWTLLPCLAALPLMAALPDLPFWRAYFEAASGLTASGATVLDGLDDLPPSLNFWRGEMSWLGGMGLIVLATAILPLLGVGGSAGFQSELPGPLKDQKLTPHIKQTAKALWVMYAVLTALCAIAYRAAGMNGHDAVMHAFTTVSLGGFSSHDASYGYFDSVAIEGVAIFFMVLAGMNFMLHYTAWHRKAAVASAAGSGDSDNVGNSRRRRGAAFARGALSGKAWRAWGAVYWNAAEWRAYMTALALLVAGVAVFLHGEQVYDDWRDTLRYAAFNTISIATTTGYVNTDYYRWWPLFAPLLMLMAANFVACSGSTGGGIKLIRVLAVLRQARTERMKLVHPAAYYTNKTMGAPMPQKALVSILFFVVLYFAFAAALMLFLVATGMDFVTAFSAAVASISNVGPGLGEVGPAGHYGHLTAAQTWACAVAMLLGRLELMSFVVVVHPSFWRY